jgi:glycosyltransferase involved in cell wall biosynthesis
MPEINPLVSVIIPAYNAEKFIDETIISVQQQTYSNWEIIIVNDGSTDNTEVFISKYISERIILICQPNAGVSIARNKGLANAKGDYIVFFDADDLMTKDFLDIRVKLLNENSEYGFAGGLVGTFPFKSKIRKAAAENPEMEILYFNPDYVTVPSNYLVRKNILLRYGIEFNTKLSSTADRFFILNLSRHSKGILANSENGMLLYRISEQSMSHKISRELIYDNEMFYYELRNASLLPKNGKSDFSSRYFFSIALGFGKVKKWTIFFKYMWLSFLESPIRFFRLLIKKIIIKGE